MKILVIGGCHVGNYGLQSSEGFLQQWANHLDTVSEEPIQITCFTLMTYLRLPTLLEQHCTAFKEADLILLQMGNYELSYRGTFRDLFSKTRSPENPAKSLSSSLTAPIVSTPLDHFKDAPIQDYPRHWSDWIKNVTKVAGLSFYQLLGGQLPILEELSHSMRQASKVLRSFASKIVVLTPFPSLNVIDHWLRRSSRSLYQSEAERNGFALLDVHQAVLPHRSYFLSDTFHLNERGHTQIARFLIKSQSVLPISAADYKMK